MSIKTPPMPSYPPGTRVRMIRHPGITGTVIKQTELTDRNREIQVRLDDGGSALGLTSMWISLAEDERLVPRYGR